MAKPCCSTRWASSRSRCRQAPPVRRGQAVHQRRVHQRRRVDVRVLAATNRDLHAKWSRAIPARLASDHLSVVPLELPSLRERDKDVVLLARHFLDRVRDEYQKPVPRLSPELERRMLSLSLARQRSGASEPPAACGPARRRRHAGAGAHAAAGRPVAVALDQSGRLRRMSQAVRPASASRAAGRWRDSGACPTGAAVSLGEALAAAVKASAKVPPRRDHHSGDGSPTRSASRPSGGAAASRDTPRPRRSGRRPPTRGGWNVRGAMPIWAPARWTGRWCTPRSFGRCRSGRTHRRATCCWTSPNLLLLKRSSAGPPGRRTRRCGAAGHVARLRSADA